MPHILMEHDNTDPKAELLEKLGDISDIEVFHNSVVVAIYQRPNKTASGIILPDKHMEEDIYQGKTCLVVKAGPQAFKGDGSWSWDDIGVGDWVFIRASNGWNISLRGKDKDKPVLCRIVKDTAIEGKVSDPDLIW